MTRTRILSIGAVGFIAPSISLLYSWEITKPEKPAVFLEQVTQIKTYTLDNEVLVSMTFQPVQSLCYETKTPEGIEAYVLDDSGFAESLAVVSQSRDSVCYALPVLETTTTLTLVGTYASGLPLQGSRTISVRDSRGRCRTDTASSCRSCTKVTYGGSGFRLCRRSTAGPSRPVKVSQHDGRGTARGVVRVKLDDPVRLHRHD